MAERLELTPAPGARGKALFPRIVSEAVMTLVERMVSARVTEMRIKRVIALGAMPS